MKRIIQRVTSVPGAFLTGFVVSLFLLPCTSGPYIVILGLLGKTATRPEALAWLVLYNLIFVLPMVAITGSRLFRPDHGRAGGGMAHAQPAHGCISSPESSSCCSASACW